MADVIAEDALARNRTPEPRKAWERLLKLAEAQGVKPRTKEQLDAMASVWPEDEDVDELIATRRQWRREGS